MELLTAGKHSKLDQDLWAAVSRQTVQILDGNKISFTSIDLVRFRWDEPTKDGPKAVTSAITIWIGVLPKSTEGSTAVKSAESILGVLKGHGIEDIDIAFRESETFLFAGPDLYAPVDADHPLGDVIEWVTVPLSFPISPFSNPNAEGTFGCYFKVGDDLYGVTARHVLFSPRTSGNAEYKYIENANTNADVQKKRVIIMGEDSFTAQLACVKDEIKSLDDTISLSTTQITNLNSRIAGGDTRGSSKMAEYQTAMQATQTKRAAVANFDNILNSEDIVTGWNGTENRVIGHVVWAPPIGPVDGGDGREYTRDVCVIKMDNQKFASLPNHIIEPGTGRQRAKLRHKRPTVKPRGVPDAIIWPIPGLYTLQAILPVTHINQGTTLEANREMSRFVFKCGRTTGATIGRVNDFLSVTRHYLNALEHFDASEVAVVGCKGEFSARGDSGSAIIGFNHDLVALLTGGTGKSLTDEIDITYATPFEWLWEKVIKPEFPGANLFF